MFNAIAKQNAIVFWLVLHNELPAAFSLNDKMVVSTFYRKFAKQIHLSTIIRLNQRNTYERKPNFKNPTCHKHTIHKSNEISVG